MKNKITFITLGSLGTFGHLSLAADVASISRYNGLNLSVSMITEECEVPSFFSQHFEEITYISPRPQSCSRGGRLNESYWRDDIKQAIDRHGDSAYFFSTFFDIEVVTKIRQKGNFCGLITYPFRNSKFELFLHEDFDQLFDEIVLLDDIVSPAESFRITDFRSDLSLLPPPIYGYCDYKLPRTRTQSDSPLSILIGCGGGLVNGSNLIFQRSLDSILRLDLKNIQLKAMPGLLANDNLFNKYSESHRIKNVYDFPGEELVDIFVGQAGYHTVHELLFHSIPSVVIPAPRLIDDQELRAIRLARLTGNKVLLPSELSKLKVLLPQLFKEKSTWLNYVSNRMAEFVQQRNWAEEGKERWRSYLHNL